MYKRNLYSDGTSEDSEGKDSSFESINDEVDSESNTIKTQQKNIVNLIVQINKNKKLKKSNIAMKNNCDIRLFMLIYK